MRIDGIDGDFLFGNVWWLNAHSSSARKLSIVGSILVRFWSCLAGSSKRKILQGVVLFLYFILQIFVAALFERGNANYYRLNTWVVRLPVTPEGGIY